MASACRSGLSIATCIGPLPVYLIGALVQVPANHAAPIAADPSFRDAADAAITMDLDWRQTGRQSWDIAVQTDAGSLTLANGGPVLTVDGQTHHADDAEYPGLYARFATLIRSGLNEVDADPLRLVADAFLRGARETIEPFYD